jgi:hypothetical protein
LGGGKDKKNKQSSAQQQAPNQTSTAQAQQAEQEKQMGRAKPPTFTVNGDVSDDDVSKLARMKPEDLKPEHMRKVMKVLNQISAGERLNSHVEVCHCYRTICNYQSWKTFGESSSQSVIPSLDQVFSMFKPQEPEKKESTPENPLEGLDTVDCDASKVAVIPVGKHGTDGLLCLCLDDVGVDEAADWLAGFSKADSSIKQHSVEVGGSELLWKMIEQEANVGQFALVGEETPALCEPKTLSAVCGAVGFEKYIKGVDFRDPEQARTFARKFKGPTDQRYVDAFGGLFYQKGGDGNFYVEMTPTQRGIAFKSGEELMRLAYGQDAMVVWSFAQPPVVWDSALVQFMLHEMIRD